MWFYDFERVLWFDEASFETYYESVKTLLRPDVTGVGFRVVSHLSRIFRSPLLLAEVRVLLCSAESEIGAVTNAVGNTGTFAHDIFKSIDQNAYIKPKKNFLPWSIPKKIHWPRPPFFNREETLLRQRAYDFLEMPSNSMRPHMSNSMCCIADPLFSPRDVIGLDENSPRGDGVKIAIIDEGINASAVIRVAGEIDLCEAISSNLHGTQVLSVLAGTDFSIAPNASYYLINVSSDRRFSTLLVAMLWAAHQHVDVINISFRMHQRAGLPEPIRRVANYCADHGCQIVCATGNEPDDLCSGLALSSEVIAVGALLPTNELRVENMTGEVKTDCVCLGTQIRSKCDLNSNCLADFYGSSSSVPIVAGCYGLFLQCALSRDNSRHSFFEHCCIPNVGAPKEYWGFGRVFFS